MFIVSRYSSLQHMALTPDVKYRSTDTLYVSYEAGRDVFFLFKLQNKI